MMLYRMSAMAGVLTLAGVLAACGGGSSSDSSDTTVSTNSGGSSASSSSSSANSSVSSSVSTSSSASSSVSSSAASSSASSTSSAVAAGIVEPVNGSTAAYADTRLKIAFDSTPSLGSTGYIKVFKSDGTLVDTIDVSDAVVTAGGENQTYVAKTNTEIDQLGYNVGTTLTQWRYVYYQPVTISGNVATIQLHNNKLAYGTSYYVTVDSGVLSGAINGTAFGGISSTTGWTFTTKSAPTSYTAVTVDDDGSTADFRSVQGALNWMMTYGCTSCTYASSAKTITINNGSYHELLFMRNVSNLTISGESRAGVVVYYDNYESYNPGSGGSKTSAQTTLANQSTAASTRRSLGGGRPVLLVEGGDMIKLTNFTLQNTHVKASAFNNQAETLYFNSATTTGSRLLATSMNFISAQDTLNLKGWVWFYNDFIAGDVDFIWGYPYAALFENCELQTIADSTDSTSGGYVIHSRAYYGYPGFVVLNSSLTAASGVPAGKTYLARSPGSTTNVCNASGTYCDDVAYINTKMGSHIQTVGWSTSPTPNPATPTATTGWREWGSLDASGATLSMTGRDTTYATSTIDLSALSTRTKVFTLWNSSTGWTPSE